MARARNCWICVCGSSPRNSSSSSASNRWISWLVRKPSKKCSIGTLPAIALRCATTAKSAASCTDAAQSIPQPALRTAITSLWSPKMDSAWYASARAATCITPGSSSPEILHISGSISSSPCDAVKVVASAPAESIPCSAPAAPPSLCISVSRIFCPNTLRLPARAHSSQFSAIGVDGVIG